MAKPTTERGNLFTRGKKNTWYVQFYMKGKQIVTRLTDRNGNAITGKSDEAEAEAKKAKARVMAPYLLRDEADLRQSAYNAMKTAGDLAAEAEAELEEERQAAKAKRNRIPIRDMWKRHPYAVNTRGKTERKLSPGTIKDNISQWTKFVNWAAEKEIMFADDVTGQHGGKFRDWLDSEGLSASRQNQITGLCAVMFRLAGIEPNPFEGMRQLAHNPKGRRELTTEELHTVCTTATGELRPLFAVGLYTGLRLGDAARLEWEEIAQDFSKIIRLPGKTSYKGQELTIPIHPVLSAILQETPKSKRKGFILPEMARRYNTDSGNLSRLIQNHFEETCKIRTHKPGTGFKRDESGKIKLDEEGNKIHTGIRAVVEVGFHSLRHSFVSICAREGVPLHVVQELCGHSTPAVQRLYLHNSTEDTSKAIASLPAIGEKVDPEETKKRARLAEFSKSLPIEHIDTLLAQAEKLAGNVGAVIVKAP